MRLIERLTCLCVDSKAAHAYNDQPYYVGQQVYGTDPDGNLLISFGYYPDLTKVRFPPEFCLSFTSFAERAFSVRHPIRAGSALLKRNALSGQVCVCDSRLNFTRVCVYIHAFSPP